MNNDINNQEKHSDDLSDILTKVEDSTPTIHNEEPKQESIKAEVEENKMFTTSESLEEDNNKAASELENRENNNDIIEKTLEETESKEPKEKIQEKPKVTPINAKKKKIKKQKKQKNKDNNSDNSEKKETKKKSLVGSCIFLVISLIFLIVSGFYFNKFVINANQIPVRKISATNDEQTVTNVKIVKIYSINKSLTRLVSSDVEVTSEDFSSEAKAIFENIKNKNNYKGKGADGKTWQFMDPSITLLDSYVVGDKIYLNISSNLIDSIHTKKQELLVLYSLINTYTALDNIKQVKILLNNKEVEKLKWYSLKTFYSENHDL